jgi:O-antigen/teichoic acid export membrane protein
MAADLKYGSMLAASNVLWSAVNQADAIIGGRILGREALGTYSVALNLALLPMNKILGVINQVAFSTAARLQDEVERLRLRVQQSLRLLAASGIALLWGMTAVAPELVRSILGAKWEPAILPLQLICLIVPFRLLMALLSTTVASIGRADVNLRNTVTAAITWPLCFLLGAQFGANGLAAAWLGAVPLSFAVNARRIAGVVGIGINSLLRCAAGSTAAGAMMLVAVAGARAATAGLSDAARLGILVGVGAAVYLGALVVLDREVVSDARRLLLAAKSRGSLSRDASNTVRRGEES